MIIELTPNIEQVNLKLLFWIFHSSNNLLVFMKMNKTHILRIKKGEQCNYSDVDKNRTK